MSCTQQKPARSAGNHVGGPCGGALATGGPLDHKRYADTFRTALKRAGITDEVRPFHDGRHTSITNAAAAGVAPGALQALAGHADLSTTQARMFGAAAPTATAATAVGAATSGGCVGAATSPGRDGVASRASLARLGEKTL